MYASEVGLTLVDKGENRLKLDYMCNATETHLGGAERGNLVGKTFCPPQIPACVD